MFLHTFLPFSNSYRKIFTSCQKYIKVAVLGAGGGVGQPLSMLLKLSPQVTDLRLHDVDHANGVAADLSHINSHSCVRGFSGPEYLSCALNDAEIVVITAGLLRKPGMTREEQFDVNNELTKYLTEACATCCPQALIVIVTNPINSLVPMAAEVMNKHGVFYPSRIFGLTTLDVVRSSTFVANLKGLDPGKVSVRCIGGHSETTILPILSQCYPKQDLKDDEVVALTKRIQKAGTVLLQAKGNVQSATLSMAYAAHRFVISLCRGLMGESNVTECAYVSSKLTEAKFFSSPLLLGRCGVERWLPLPPLSKYENQLLKKVIHDLIKQIERGEKFLCK